MGRKKSINIVNEALPVEKRGIYIDDLQDIYQKYAGYSSTTIRIASAARKLGIEIYYNPETKRKFISTSNLLELIKGLKHHGEVFNKLFYPIEKAAFLRYVIMDSPEFSMCVYLNMPRFFTDEEIKKKQAEEEKHKILRFNQEVNQRCYENYRTLVNKSTVEMPEVVNTMKRIV